jgi:hypothetical protein
MKNLLFRWLIKRWATGQISPGAIKTFAIVALTFVLTSVAAAQQCDPLLPCGPLPWQLPSLPNLASPTPIPTLILTAVPPTPTPGGTPAATSAPFVVPTWTPFIDTSGLNNAAATLNAVANATSVPIYDLAGTPVDSDQTIATLQANTTTVFSYIRGLPEISFGPLTPLVTFVFIALFLFLAFNIIHFVFPLVMAIFGFIRRIVTWVLDFLPF